MFPKFDAVPVGGSFVADGRPYRKLSAFTYVEIENEVMGEQSINPFIELTLNPNPKPDADPTKKFETKIVQGDLL